MKIHVRLAAVLLLGALFSCQKEDQRPPNILFILVDDLGYADLGFSGSPFHDTPHLDQLAGESWQFTHGYSGSRVCSPARATIMTGQFTARHGITDWIGAKTGENWREHNRFDPMLPADYQHALDPAHTTLAEAFKAQGYHTFYAGKWHLGDEGSYPEDHGFDRNVAGWDKGSPVGGFFSPYQNPKVADGPAGENLTTRLAREVAAYMEEQREQPFFAMLSFYAVHAPLQTTQEKWAKYREKAHQLGVAPEGFEMGEKLPFRKVQDNPVYAGLVESVDDAVGIVINQLKTLGLYDNTIIVFTSDNGGVVAGDAFATSNLVVKGGKGQHWEGGTRVPYLIRTPYAQPTATITYPVTGADFFPTLLDLANQPLLPTQHLDGVSLKPLLQGYELPERSLIWHYPHYGNQGGVPSSVIRKGPWKLIHHWEDNHQELYHVLDDPLETENKIQQHPEVRATLGTELNHFLEQTYANLPQPDPMFDKEKYDARITDMRTRLLPNLEKQRMDFLDPTWQPNPDWWGSQPVTVD
ncbi:MAG: sulfatase [Lunatimonas sp.]|uniref:sulfatase n=1 Tax=Lunatimonas sp. TaxID=2060141 RepID=UPI00263A8427|nr:sulfatase [Lunatimonas sp.]MCC5935908.1 sulfatase [Lunatimonas sp.]